MQQTRDPPPPIEFAARRSDEFLDCFSRYCRAAFHRVRREKLTAGSEVGAEQERDTGRVDREHMDWRRRAEATPPSPASSPASPASPASSDSGDAFDLKTSEKRERKNNEGGVEKPPARKRRLVGDPGGAVSGGAVLPPNGRPQSGRSGSGEGDNKSTSPRFRHHDFAMEARAACLIFCSELLRESVAGVPLSALPPELLGLISRFVVSGSHRFLVRFDHLDRLERDATLHVPDMAFLPLELVSLPGGRQLLASGGKFTYASIALWDLASRECVATLVLPDGSRRVSCLASFSGLDFLVLRRKAGDD
jgi:hypothetical protein